MENIVDQADIVETQHVHGSEDEHNVENQDACNVEDNKEGGNGDGDGKSEIDDHSTVVQTMAEATAVISRNLMMGDVLDEMSEEDRDKLLTVCINSSHPKQQNFIFRIGHCRFRIVEGRNCKY
jgi:hypothetical protein